MLQKNNTISYNSNAAVGNYNSIKYGKTLRDR